MTGIGSIGFKEITDVISNMENIEVLKIKIE